jgi:hypothetical protein
MLVIFTLPTLPPDRVSGTYRVKVSTVFAAAV